MLTFKDKDIPTFGSYMVDSLTPLNLRVRTWEELSQVCEFMMTKLKESCQEIDLLRAEIDFLKERELMASASKQFFTEPE